MADAYPSGYEEGFKAGESDSARMAAQRMREWEDAAQSRLSEAEEQLQRERARLASMADALELGLKHHLEMIEPLSFELAWAGWQCAFGELGGDRELLARIISGLVAEYRGKALVIEVSSADRESLPDHLDGVEVIVASALGAGECRVRTARGEVESSVAMRMDGIYRAMRAAMEGSTA
ncbi:hypothetical protein [Dyella solisilvae]|uniref:FliH/SctL family protein n=1 Tax=Dyella solisilvae TaxID=1920168 RepID=UPI0011C07A11|nr:hypothetical protein [Dyella solisilvae]